MQTVLENLEETYLQLEQLLEDDGKNLINLDTAGREEVQIALENTIKNIVLLLVNDTANVVPQDSRVYNSLVNTPTYLHLHSAWQDDVMDKLYKHDIFHKEMTVGELIEELQKFAPNLKVDLEVADNNVANKTFNKIAIDDTSTNCITLVGVEQ